MNAEDDSVVYLVQESERAESDRSNIFLRLTPIAGPERAKIIYQDLQFAMQELAKFPGPLANSIDFQATELFRMEIRRTLYYGPRPGRRLSIPYRILYTIIDSEPGGREGIIRILRVLHGSQELNPKPE